MARRRWRWLLVGCLCLGLWLTTLPALLQPAIAQPPPEIQQTIWQLHNQAVEQSRQGNWQGAIERWQQVLQHQTTLQDRAGIAATCGNLGKTYRVIGRYDLAMKWLDRAVEIAQPLEAPLLLAQLLNNRGNVHSTLGNYDSAIRDYQAALPAIQAAKHSPLEATLLNNLGAAYLERGNHNQALHYYQSSLTLAESLDDRAAIAQALNNLATVYLTSNQADPAVPLLERSAAIATELPDPAPLVAIWSNLGLSYDMRGNYPQAIALHERALQVARDRQLPNDMALALNNLAHAALMDRQLERAEQALNEATAFFDRLRDHLNDQQHIDLLDLQTRTYNLLRQVQTAAQNHEAALLTAERGRATALARLMARNSLNVPVNNNRAEQPLNLDAIRQWARDRHSTVIEYLFTPEDRPLAGRMAAKVIELNIWVIQPDGSLHFRQVPIATDTQPIDQVQGFQIFMLGSRGPEPAASVALPDLPADREVYGFLRGLYELTVAPIADLLPTAVGARVTIVPHDCLFLVPFAALQAPDRRYVVERYALSITPSLQTLLLSQARAQQLTKQGQRWRDRPLIVGNPIMPKPPKGDPLKPLPYAEQEANFLGRLLQSQPLIGAQATKAAIRAQWQQASLLHLATHAILDSQNGLESAIALTPTATDPGWLLAKDLMDQNLTASLAVLSACNTGRGRIGADGVIGLARAFLAAGVPRLVVSQWSVPDSPTADMMAAFYQSLLHQPRPAGAVSAALRHAMLQQMRHSPSPRDWAGFMVVGSDD